MNKDYRYWFRWLAVFPGAVLLGLLVTFPLHWILYLGFAHKGASIFGLIKFPNGLDIKFIEYALYPPVIAFTSILAGYKIAPNYKFRTAFVLFGIYAFLWFISTVTVLFLKIENVQISFSVRTILALLGAVAGLYVVSRRK